MDNKIDWITRRLKVLAHPTRIQIVNLLSQTSQMNVSEFIEHLQLEQSLVSHHLIKMKDHGILSQSRNQKNIYYALSDTTLAEPLQLIIDTLQKQKVR